MTRYGKDVIKSARTYRDYSFVVRWPGENGTRKVKWFTNDSEATEHAKRMAGDVGELGESFAPLSEA